MAKFQDLLGTVGNYFKLGISGPRLKNSTGRVDIRDSADANFASLRANQLEVVDNAGVVLTLDAVDALGAATTIKFPAKGTDGQFFRQKAGTPAGVIEFELAAVAGSADKVGTDTTALAFGTSSPLALFNLPANAVVEAVRVIIDTPFNGVPSLSVGITGTLSKYLASGQVDLTAPATTSFEVYPSLPASGSVESLIATYAAGGATAGSARIEIDYVVPT